MSDMKTAFSKASSDDRDMVELAMDLARGAGAKIQKAIKAPKTIQNKSSSTDLVTETDEACEQYIIDGIKAKYPDHGFIAEESDNTYSADIDYKGVTWIIDPLDGTNNFAHGLPLVCVSIGIMRDNIVVGGVVFIPVLEEMYVSIKGHGAYLNGEVISASQVTEVQHAAIATECGYNRSSGAITTLTGRLAGLLMQRAQSVRMFGSAAINMLFVAAGRLDAYFEEGPKPWDSSAASLIVTEANGCMGDWATDQGFSIFTGRVICAGTKELLEAMNKTLNVEYTKE